MSSDYKLQDERREYLLGSLNWESLEDNPFKQFQLWFEQFKASEAQDPTAMIVATVDEYGMPSQRTVLLKDLRVDDGFVFYTNYNSRKSQELMNNHKASIHFPWLSMERQVFIQGIVERLPYEENAAYFSSRPRASQLAALASEQSEVITGREQLEQRFNELDEQYRDQLIPAPEHWGGFIVRPLAIEFWQGGAMRLHDRFVYQREKFNQAWQISQLAP